MAQNRIPDGQVLRFGTMELHGNLVSVSDTHKPRNAVHEYLKRDGGEVEYMGRSPKRFRFSLTFTGDNFRRQYLNFQATVDAEPRGLLVHPLLGSIPCMYDGTEGATIDLSHEQNSITLPVAFLENRVDTNLQIEQEARSIYNWQQAVSNFIANLEGYAAPFTSSGATTALATVSAYAFDYATAASGAASTNVPDPSLDVRLGAVAASTQALIVAILADDAATSDAFAFSAIDAAEQTYAACLELSAAVDLQRPPLVVFTVEGTVSIATLAARLYGKDALARIDEILTLNRIATPYAIPTGTTLRIFAPTVQ